MVAITCRYTCLFQSTCPELHHQRLNKAASCPGGFCGWLTTGSSTSQRIARAYVQACSEPAYQRPQLYEPNSSPLFPPSLAAEKKEIQQFCVLPRRPGCTCSIAPYLQLSHPVFLVIVARWRVAAKSKEERKTGALNPNQSPPDTMCMFRAPRKPPPCRRVFWLASDESHLSVMHSGMGLLFHLWMFYHNLLISGTPTVIVPSDHESPNESDARAVERTPVYGNHSKRYGILLGNEFYK